MENSNGENHQQKLPKIKIFQTIQVHLSALGICPKSAMQSRRFSSRMSACLLVLVSGIICLALYVLNDAETFFEYTQSIYVCSAYTTAALILIIMDLKSSELFQLIDGFECLLNSSKWKIQQSFRQNFKTNKSFSTLFILSI